METVVLTDNDYYMSSNGYHLRGGNRLLYEASLVIKMNRNGGYEVIKDREGLTNEQIEAKIGLVPDKRLLLMM